MTNSHKRRNIIERIWIGGEWLEGEGEVRTGIVNAFKGLLSDPGVWIAWIASPEGLDFSRLDDLATTKLEKSFIEDEVHSALLDLNGDKALRPNGFTVAFWQFS